MGGQWRSHRPLPCSLAAANVMSGNRIQERMLMARSPSKPFHCSVISENVSIALRRRSSFAATASSTPCSEVIASGSTTTSPHAAHLDLSRGISPGGARAEERSSTSSITSTQPTETRRPTPPERPPGPGRELFEITVSSHLGPCIEAPSSGVSPAPALSLLAATSRWGRGCCSWPSPSASTAPRLPACPAARTGAMGRCGRARSRNLDPREAGLLGFGCGTGATSRC